MLRQPAVVRGERGRRGNEPSALKMISSFQGPAPAPRPTGADPRLGVHGLRAGPDGLLGRLPPSRAGWTSRAVLRLSQMTEKRARRRARAAREHAPETRKPA